MTGRAVCDVFSWAIGGKIDVVSMVKIQKSVNEICLEP